MEAIITSILSFVSTNLDDLFVVLILFSQVGKIISKRDIVIGQYLGLGSLLLVSIWISNSLKSVPTKELGYLGLIPIFLGIKSIIDYRKSKNSSNSGDNSKELAKVNKAPILEVFLITIANGADNIGVYVPLFSGHSTQYLIMTSIVFMIMIGVWCFLGDKLANISIVKEKLQKYGHIVVPVVFIGLGLYIILSSGLIK